MPNEMRFKAPRCADTDPHLFKIRDVKPEEGIRCEVGMGECSELAIEAQDDGQGGPFYLCKQHAKEFREFAVLVAEMTPDQVNNLERCIKEADTMSFPIMEGDGISSIPWGMIRSHEAQAVKNHGQTLQRLAERGGLGPCEAIAILDDKDYRDRWPTVCGDAEQRYASTLLKQRVLEYESW